MEKSIFYKIGAPVLLGLATLTRTNTLILPIFIVSCIFLKYPFKMAIKNSLIMVILFGLTMMPWIIRNYQVQHAFVPSTSYTGHVFWGANNDLAGGKWNEHGPNWKKYKNLPELEKDKQYFNEGVKWLRSQSFFQLIKLYALKTSVFFYPFFSLPDSGYDLSFGLILPFWILGMYVSIKSKDRNRNLLLLSVILVFFITTLIFYTNDRLRSPISPFIIIFSAIGIYFISDKLRAKNHNYRFFAAWSILNILIYFYSEPIHSTLIIALRKIRG